MIYRDPKCVYVNDNMALASVVATWLGSQGIPAQVMNQNTLGGFEGVLSFTPGVCHKGIEVWVMDPEHAQRALLLLKEHADQIAADAEARASLTGAISVLCEECGKSAEFPASQMGTVQNCPHCFKFVDVPDPHETWDAMDEPESDE